MAYVFCRFSVWSGI
ncbi:hypothetical protein LSQ72_25190 [Enterobacter hormaechei]|nr:hypothetical protein [Enterobacter hormaechei]MCD6631220.1 hypothetical protein [Enterobacter hormaechei]